MRRFLLIFTILLGLLYAYIGERIAGGSWIGWVVLGFPILLIWLVPTILWSRGRDDAGPGAQLFQIAAYVSMGFGSNLLVLTVARDLFLLLFNTTGLQPEFTAALTGPDGCLGVVAAATLALVVGMLAALRWPRVHKVDVPIDGLAAGLDGLLIAQISDLHVGPIIRSLYVRRVIERTNALGADFVALTGDLVDGTTASLGPIVDQFKHLTAKAFFVPGNHEYYWNAPAWCAYFANLGVTVLANASATFEKGGARLHIGGVTDPAAGRVGDPSRPDPRAALAGGERADFRLLLAHQPGIAAEAAALGYDLQLSGHTHAGQFFPWTLVVRFIHRHVGGLKREGRAWVYVSPGTGSWGPPVRLGSSTEITLLRLVRA